MREKCLVQWEQQMQRLWGRSQLATLKEETDEAGLGEPRKDSRRKARVAGPPPKTEWVVLVPRAVGLREESLIGLT